MRSATDIGLGRCALREIVGRGVVGGSGTAGGVVVWAVAEAGVVVEAAIVARAVAIVWIATGIGGIGRCRAACAHAHELAGGLARGFGLRRRCGLARGEACEDAGRVGEGLGDDERDAEVGERAEVGEGCLRGVGVDPLCQLRDRAGAALGDIEEGERGIEEEGDGVLFVLHAGMMPALA